MRLDAIFAGADHQISLRELSLPLDLDRLAGGGGPWEIELGFGKGRYLIERATAHPERRFLGVEIVSKYFRMAVRRARHRALANVVAVRGEALYLLATVLPRGFASAVHVYFPDPWPKSRHQKRRLFDPETVDLVLGLLAPGGELFFATDHLEYGEVAAEILEGFPGLAVERLAEPWPDGARTNYEAKYMAEGRPILRLRAALDAGVAPSLHPLGLHPLGQSGVLVAPRGPQS